MLQQLKLKIVFIINIFHSLPHSLAFFKSKATMFERAVSTRHFGSRDRRLKAKDFMLKEQPKFAVYRRNYGIRSFSPL